MGTFDSMWSPPAIVGLDEAEGWAILRRLRDRLAAGLDDEARNRQLLAEDALTTLDDVLAAVGEEG